MTSHSVRELLDGLDLPLLIGERERARTNEPMFSVSYVDTLFYTQLLILRTSVQFYVDPPHTPTCSVPSSVYWTSFACYCRQHLGLSKQLKNGSSRPRASEAADGAWRFCLGSCSNYSYKLNISSTVIHIFGFDIVNQQQLQKAKITCFIQKYEFV